MSLFSVFIYDLDSPCDERNRWFLLFEAVLWHGLCLGLIQPIFAFLVGSVACPLASLAIALFAICRYGFLVGWRIGSIIWRIGHRRVCFANSSIQRWRYFINFTLILLQTDYQGSMGHSPLSSGYVKGRKLGILCSSCLVGLHLVLFWYVSPHKGLVFL